MTRWCSLYQCLCAEVYNIAEYGDYCEFECEKCKHMKEVKIKKEYKNNKLLN